MRILVTGGAGFIGANFLNMWVPRHPEHKFLNLDALTYAGNLRNLESLGSASNYQLERVDIAEADRVKDSFTQFEPDAVVHFAAESHVDRSIVSPEGFFRTNVMGTLNLLEAARSSWRGRPGVFHHVSTDEVYGSLGPSGAFSETTRYDPSSPYSASKAASDHLVRSYARTFGLRTRITNCSNNYGPYQFPEKLIPLMLLNCLEDKPMPVYGNGQNVRDWLHVSDHCRALWAVLHNGRDGETYNIGGNAEVRNLDVVQEICRFVAELTGEPVERKRELITFVPDRPGHDQRYAIDASKIRAELGWIPSETFESGLRGTIRWYLEHSDWVEEVRSGEYVRWVEQNYGERR